MLSHISTEEIFSLMPLCTEDDKIVINKAFEFAKKGHEGQVRKNGDPYFFHVFETGKNLAKLQMDTTTIVAGIMHDLIEDTDITREDIEKEFGEEVAFLVEGVSKLGKLKYQGIERHAESLRKFFVAMSNDIRVVIIKLADRLHNVHTIEFLPPEKQKRVALETIEIHARLADRLGMGRLRAELEDGSFPYAFPEEYAITSDLVKKTVSTTDEHLQKIAHDIEEELNFFDIDILRMSKRIKHLYSLHQKLKKYNMDINKIYDIVALRIIVKDIPTCYQTLGIIHSMYKPLPGRIKDYIAIPKPNGYRSLHTTVFDGEGSTFEIQIRTDEMHKEAEFGVASHLQYKDSVHAPNKQKIKEKTDWTRHLLEIQSEVAESSEFLKLIKMDFFENRIFVYTPKGDVIELPEGSSPIDFAYAIHTGVGNQLQSAMVNGKIASLNTELRRGDIVQIVTNAKSIPNRKWIELCKTAHAKKQIKNYLKANGSTLDKLFIK